MVRVRTFLFIYKNVRGLIVLYDHSQSLVYLLIGIQVSFGGNKYWDLSFVGSCCTGSSFAIVLGMPRCSIIKSCILIE